MSTLEFYERTQGKEKDKFVGGSIFVDHSTTYIFLVHQTMSSGGNTIVSKHNFEEESGKFGVIIKKYHIDNMSFRRRESVTDLQKNNQAISYLGFGNHHQNWITEHTNGTVTS